MNNEDGVPSANSNVPRRQRRDRHDITSALLQRQSSSATHIISNTSAQDNKSSNDIGAELSVFYRVTFRGMIALLEEPSVTAKRTDNYLTYGDVFTCDNNGQVEKIWTSSHSVKGNSLGYLVADNVAVQLKERPRIERGSWHYKIISSTPVPILTGPLADAPRTKAVVLPGSVQAISLRIQNGLMWYLRLNHRTGWIADGKELAGRIISVVEEIVGPSDVESCCDSSVRSGTTVSRHRPPRRSEISMSSTAPSSNISILSEDSSSFDKAVDQFFLMKVTASKGLKILDTPQLQVHHLIHKDQHHRAGIFQTMTSRTLTSTPVFDGKSRILPNNSIFETSTSDCSSNMLKLSDGSGWATLPHQSSAQCIGSAQLNGDSCTVLRVMVRSGLHAVAIISRDIDEITSPTSSRGSDFQSSDVASSVGSSLLDAMFRNTPGKKMPSTSLDPPQVLPPTTQGTIPCGMAIEVEKWARNVSCQKEYARLRGGQGWVPLFVNGSKPTTARVNVKPTTRTGSFWFRVRKGQNVRLGPSKRAPSIRSNEGDFFRFECGEFLRASEEVTFYSEPMQPLEAFCKLYRNRHARLHLEDDGFRTLESLSTLGEWVQIHDDQTDFLERCDEEPRIERHRQGWRYTSVPDDGVAIRKGPSFASEKTGILLYGGETVVVNERVSPPGEEISWLRMKDGSGWVHTIDEDEKIIMVPHSQRHRTFKPNSTSRGLDGDVTSYDAIVSRLFQGDGRHDDHLSTFPRDGPRRS
jgi:hypothetical protein